MTVTPTTLIDAESAPTIGGLWALAYFLSPDWSGGFEVRTFFHTAVDMSVSASEQRRAYTRRPTRLVKLPIQTHNQDGMRAAMAMMQRATMAGVLAPIVPDTVRVTQDAAAGESVLYVEDLGGRRFYVGQYAIVWTYDRIDSQLATSQNHQLVQIQSITSNSITIAGVFALGVVTGVCITPLIESDPVLTSSIDAQTDWHASGEIELLERVGPSALPARVEVGSVPAGMATHTDGLPIFVPQIDWDAGVRVGVNRHGEASGLGTGRVFTVYGGKAAEVLTFPVVYQSRESSDAFLDFCESRGGRQHPFWMLSPVDAYRLATIDTNSIEVSAVGPVRDWNERQHVGVQLFDGTVYIREITGVTRSGSTDLLSLDQALPAIDPAQIKRVTAARLVRFESDELVEGWFSDTSVRCTLNVIELINEQTIDIADLSTPVTTPAAAVDPDLCGPGEPLTCDGVNWDANPNSEYAVQFRHIEIGSVQNDIGGSGAGPASIALNHLDVENRIFYLSKGSSWTENDVETTYNRWMGSNNGDEAIVNSYTQADGEGTEGIALQKVIIEMQTAENTNTGEMNFGLQIVVVESGTTSSPAYEGTGTDASFSEVFRTAASGTTALSPGSSMGLNSVLLEGDLWYEYQHPQNPAIWSTVAFGGQVLICRRPPVLKTCLSEYDVGDTFESAVACFNWHMNYLYTEVYGLNSAPQVTDGTGTFTDPITGFTFAWATSWYHSGEEQSTYQRCTWDNYGFPEEAGSALPGVNAPVVAITRTA